MGEKRIDFTPIDKSAEEPAKAEQLDRKPTRDWKLA